MASPAEAATPVRGWGGGRGGRAPTPSPERSPDAVVGFAFFVFILAGFEKEQRLPRRFAQDFGGHPPAELLLRERSGEQVNFKVATRVDDDGDLYLAAGWEFFAEEYDLCEGWLVLFRYCGGGRLVVRIFDGAQCRRFYQPWADRE